MYGAIDCRLVTGNCLHCHKIHQNIYIHLMAKKLMDGERVDGDRPEKLHVGKGSDFGN